MILERPSEQISFRNSSHRERDENYFGAVATLNDRWRVIECRDQIQWILQRRDGETSGQARWTGFKYFRRRDCLIAACRQSAGEVEPIAAAVLENLPEFHGGAHV